MQTLDIQRKWDLTAREVEVMRNKYGGIFGVTHSRRAKTWMEIFEDTRSDFRTCGVDASLADQLAVARANKFGVDVVDQTYQHNIVTNQGLDHFLDVELSAATQISSWYVAIFKTNTTPLATHTYASPGYTEIAGSDVTEANRQAWTDGGVSGQSLSNTASPATYTANTSVTIYGAAMVGGGSSPSVIANTAGGGTLSASSLFASSKAMAATDTLDVTYTRTAADDGV